MKNTKSNAGSFTTVKFQNKMHRFLVIIAFIAITGFIITSCGGGGGDDEEQVITISGTFGGAYIAGKSYPVRINIRFDYDGTSVYMEKDGEWSINHLPFEEDVTLWFLIQILTKGTSEDTTESITYQLSNFYRIKDQGMNNIVLPKIDIPELITLSGTASTTLQGTWNRSEKHTNVQVENKSLNTNPIPDHGPINIKAGWTNATTRVKDGNWTLRIPSSKNDTNINFSVQLDGTKISENLWEMGQKTGLKPQTVTEHNITGIPLGTIPFVMVSGDTPVTVNGKRPYSYWIEFGYYWDENNVDDDEDNDVDINGWSGTTMTFLEGMGSAWSVPMPANTKLIPEIFYREKSSLQFRKSKVSKSSFDTGTQAYTLNLSSISKITN